MKKLKLCVLGAGSWGTTIANHLSLKGFTITLWARRKELCTRIKKTLENPDYLEGIKLSESILFTDSLEEAVKDKDIIIIAVPTQGLREVVGKIGAFIARPIIVSATKGIEEDTLLTPTGIIREVIPTGKIRGVCVLSGPSFAKEVALRLPTAVTAASKKREIAEEIQELFNTHYFRVYTNSDVLGVELGGALKNVVAIAAGIGDSLELGSNSRAALITRGLSEITRLGLRMGARKETFSGLSGLGDLCLTCTGKLSRNRYVGTMLGKGYSLKDILFQMKMVAEGIKTTRSAYMLAERLKVEMPITKEVYSILYENKPPREAVLELMTRELREE